MDSLGNIPFLRPVMALCLGIGLAFSLLSELANSMLFLLILIPVLAVVAYLLVGMKANRRFSISGILVLLSIFLTGFTTTYYAQLDQRRSFFDNPRFQKYSHLKIVLDDEVSDRKNSWRSRARVVAAFDSSGQEWTTSGDILVYWPHTGNPQKPDLQYGDILIIGNRSIELPRAAFPGDFDFKSAMRFRNVSHEIFLKKSDWKWIGNSASFLFRTAYYCRNTLVHRLHELLPEKEAALMASLIIGYRAQVDQEDLKAFAVSGTTHVLAVSGLHVGLLYLLLLLVFTGKKKSKGLNRWQGVLVILLLWIFALITGLSASVVRAALMFTILEAGRSLVARRGNLLNSLFAAAFFQLLIEPLAFFDAGFQLSYLAVLGIAIIHPRLNAIWTPKQKWLYYLFQSAMLSVSATIATLPVTLFYFKTFPVWFIPSNLWIVPLSTVAIVAGILSLTLGWMPVLGMIVCKIATWLTAFLTLSARFFADLPFSSIQNIEISGMEVFLLFDIIIFMLAYFILRKKSFLAATLISCMFMGVFGFFHRGFLMRTNKVIACEIGGELILVHHVDNHLNVYSRPISSSKADSIKSHFDQYSMAGNIGKVIWHMQSDGFVKYKSSAIGSFSYRGKKYAMIWYPRLSPDLEHDQIGIQLSKLTDKQLQGEKPIISLKRSFVML